MRWEGEEIELLDDMKEMPYKCNKETVCEENPLGCSFQIMNYSRNTERSSVNLGQHVLLFCQSGHIRITSNKFKEEFLCAGEILFVPRGSDYYGVALSNTILFIHYFNNTVCHAENCILSYLYTHKHIEPKEGKSYFYSKLTVCKQLLHLLDGINGYIDDKTHEPNLWKLKHKELIWLFSKYYTPEELQLFFHPMTDEQIPFKSLVLTHYRKANCTKELAELCGYGLHTFRRIFKNEFGIPVYRWLIQKRAEHIKHRLSMPYIPFSDIIDEFNFSSAQHFNSFCKQYLGDTPGNLRKENTSFTK